MGQSDSRVFESAEASLLDKIWDLLERKPWNYDVVFCVGKEKKLVRALKFILKASSPFLEKEFEEKWEVAVIKEGDGIPLPDFDPIAFELFVKLTSLDTWSLENLKTLNLPPNKILNLLSICRRFEMKKAVENLEILVSICMQSFGEFKDTEDFLQLSQKNLKSFLGSDNIDVNELDVFNAAIRWAEFQCKELKVEPTEEHIRKVLGDSLFEIRFPIMTSAEFTKTAESKDILTAEQNLGIYRFIGLEASKRLEFDSKKLPFKTTPRKKAQTLMTKPNSETNSIEGLVPSGISKLYLTQGSQIVENPPFVCDDRLNSHYISCEKNITVYGLGFLGPIESNGFCDVKVHIVGQKGIEYDSGLLEKRIFAKKGKLFYFVFDAPIDLKAGSLTEWTNYYEIYTYVKGANTFASNRAFDKEFFLRAGGTQFILKWYSSQLVEILFK